MFLLFLYGYTVFISCKKKNFNEDGITTIVPGALQVLSINPSAAQLGNTVTILGKNFGTVASIVGVKINNTTVPFNLINDTMITVVIPSGIGSGAVAVTKNTTSVTGPSFEYLFTGRSSLYAGSDNLMYSFPTAATNINFAQLEGFDVDAAGNMFVCDYVNKRVVKINPAGTASTYFGVFPGVTIPNNLPFQSNFSPSDVSVDAANKIYVSSGNNVLYSFRNDSAIVIAGTGATGYFNSNTYYATFNLPRAMQYISNTQVLVSDLNNHCIRNINPSDYSSNVTTLSATNAAGDAVGTAAATRFNLPAFISKEDNNNILIADFNNAKIKRVNISTGATSTVIGSTAGNVLGPIASARITKPNCAVRDNLGNILIAEYESGYIKCISPSGVVYNLMGSGNITGYAEGLGAAARFKQLGKVVTVGNKTFYIGDIGNKRIRKIILE